MDDVLIVAAEASSSLYALRLLEHWKATNVPVSAFGIGSRDMEAHGFEVLGRSEDMAVVGLQEVVAHYPRIRRTFFRLLEEARRRKPKVAVLLDYPEFNLRLAKKLKALGIPVVYYISPQIWAWRTSRVNIVRAHVAKMLVIFPFEKAFYEKHNAAVEFVGHPLLDELAEIAPTPEATARRRAELGFKPGDVVLALMPGSRDSEIKHHLAVQMQAARLLKAEFPNLRLILPVAPTLDEAEIRSEAADSGLEVTYLKDEPFSMIALADVVLCASGTATLQVGLLAKPMVIMYRMSPLTVFLARWIMKRPAHFGLINLILGERVAPELFQDEATPEAMAGLLSPLIRSAENRREVAARLVRCRELLGSRGATARVAAALQPYLDRP